MGLFYVDEIRARTRALGLGGITEKKAAAAVEAMAEADVALGTHGAGGPTLPPVEMRRAAGVLVFAGNDDIRETWSPYGTGDLLERAAVIGWKSEFRRDDQIEIAFDLVSAAGARALGIALRDRGRWRGCPLHDPGQRTSHARTGIVRRARRRPRRRRAAGPGADRLSAAPGRRIMDQTPPPVSLTAALALPRTPGRSAEVFVDADLELRFAARPTNGPQVPHQRDEVYFVAAGTGRYRVEDKVTAVGAGDLLFCAAHVAHGFEDISADFCVWVLFYGPQK
jgi:mannose-6-phosphate isomerase-like protein (cupin superfamily)